MPIPRPRVRRTPLWLQGRIRRGPARKAWRHELPLFPKRFRELCRESKLRPKRLSAELGIHVNLIIGYANGCGAVRDHLIAIAGYFDVSIDWLLGLRDDRERAWVAAGRRAKGEQAKLFVDRLRMLLRESGLSQTKCSQRVGLSFPVINRLVRGLGGPKPGSVLKLARYWNVSADWLLGLSDRR